MKTILQHAYANYFSTLHGRMMKTNQLNSQQGAYMHDMKYFTILRMKTSQALHFANNHSCIGK